MFCNEFSDAYNDTWTQESICKLEIATILAHIQYETDSLQQKSQSGCNDPTDIKSSCDYVDYSLVEALTWPPYTGVQYYGRGAFQIQYNQNYGAFSDIAYNGGLYDKMTLLEKPQSVA